MPIDPKKEQTHKFGNAYRCRDCLYGAIQPRPSSDDIADFYDLENYYTHGRFHFADGGARSLGDRLRMQLAWRMDFGQAMTPGVAHELLGGRASFVCDVGCGTGSFAAQMKAYGHTVVGVEPDRRAAEKARQQGVKWFQGTAESLPEEVVSTRFDLLIISHVLEHCIDPDRAFHNVSCLVRPGGLLICEVPNNASMGLRFSGLAWEPLDIPRHLNFFVPKNLLTLSERHGLRAQSFYYSHYHRQFSNEWINTERRIWDAVQRVGGGAYPRPIKNSKTRAWILLLRTALASSAGKYDTVGLIAEKPLI
jgi:2-polyprenyl-3-methyl-5-hydroxy-6-metoxy-1,4-benzoquinol methylase